MHSPESCQGRFGADARQQPSTFGRMPATILATPAPVGCMPSPLIELRIVDDAVEKERIEQQVVRRGKLRIDRVERARIVRPQDSAPPACRTTAPRCCAPSGGARSRVSASRVTLGSMPRSMSLAPSSRITASVPSGTDQSSRASPPVVVSPETPALATSTARPLALSARSSCTGNAAFAGKLIARRQRIAERHDLDRPFGRAAAAAIPRQTSPAQSRAPPQAAGPYGPASHMSGARNCGRAPASRPHERHLLGGGLDRQTRPSRSPASIFRSAAPRPGSISSRTST